MTPSKYQESQIGPRELWSVKEVWETLGVLDYQRAFIKDFAKIARPLHDLTKNDTTFKWTEECTIALDELIKAVTSEPVLYQPDFTKQFELEIDSSLFAVGAVLFQKDEEGWRCPVSYYSALLNEAERNYDIWDREFLGMIHGLKHNWHLLIGSPHKVLVFTDHENLAHYQHPQKINRRVAWYLHVLADFDLELCHIPETTNKANTLSRRPDHYKGAKDNEAIIALPDSLFAQALQIGKLDKDIRTSKKRNSKVFAQWKKSYQCQEINGTLYKDGALVVTMKGTAWKDLLRRYHDSITVGHLGVWKTLQSLRKDYWWPNMRLYIQRYIGGCATCQQNKMITNRNTPPLQPIVPEENATPFATVAMDFVVKLPKFKGNNSILTVIDQGYTKAVILLPCKETMGSEEIVELLKDRAFPYIGIPMRVISDHDPRFTSSLFKELYKALGVWQNISTAYHPQTDGQSEWTNQLMEDLLCIFYNYQQDNWAEWLPVVQYILNSWPLATTQKAPYKVWMGHILLAHQVAVVKNVPRLEEWVKLLKTIRKDMIDAITKAQGKWQRNTGFKLYKPGEQVWLEGTHLHTTHLTRKLRPKRYRLFKVLRTIEEVSYQLELPAWWKIHNVFYAKLLQPYVETEEYGINFQEPPSDLIKGEEEWEVEQILDERKQGQTQQYLIHWKGYLSAHDLWEPITDINAPDLISDFHKQKMHVKRVQKDWQNNKGRGNIAHLCCIVMSSPIQPPSSCNSNERAAWYAECWDIPHTSDTPLSPNELPYAINHLSSASPEPLMIPPTGSLKDIRPSVSKCASPNPAKDILMETQSVGNNFKETIQLFWEVDQELDTALRLSPSVFSDAPQLRIQSAGLPEVVEGNLSVMAEERCTPCTSTPVELEVEEGPLPLEPADSTDEQSTDTQISSHAPHSGYSWI